MDLRAVTAGQEICDLSLEPEAARRRLSGFAAMSYNDKSAMSCRVGAVIREPPDMAANSSNSLQSIPETARRMRWEDQFVLMPEDRRFLLNGRNAGFQRCFWKKINPQDGIRLFPPGGNNFILAR